jgi:hypothetical protein
MILTKSQTSQNSSAIRKGSPPDYTGGLLSNFNYEMKKPHGFNYHAAFFMMDFYVLYYFMSVPHWCHAANDENPVKQMWILLP